MDELDELFNEAHKGYLSITETQLSSNSPEYQQQVRQALQAINSVSDLISQEQIFSSNEELDDIRTDYMKFLLVPYYEAELQLCIVDKERLDHLNSAKLYYLHFLRHCEKLSLVHKDDLKSLYSENRDNPTALRALLIDRIKREKEAKLKLAAFQKERAASATVDEELERNCWLAMTSCAVPNAVRQLESTEKEIKMLESVADMPKRDVRDSRGNQITPSSNSNNNNFNYNNNNNNNNDKPIAYTILPGGRRVELKRQVFQPGFNMATITPEEAYEAEVKAGRMVTGGGKASEPDPDKEGEDEDDDIDNEAKLQKARYWDNFKDDNPFGSGNSRRG